MDTNVLYYGDNLKILRDIPDNTIDLIYLDPPFNSKATYNVLFKEPSGKSSEAQITAFEDTWHWGNESERTLLELQNSKVASPQVKELMNLLPILLGRNDMMAYLSMMCIRLIELRRVLNDTGSIYLHCDTTASHYLKILMDAIFGVTNFVNEIAWRRSQTRSSISRVFRRNHDSILFYSKTDRYPFNMQYKSLSEASLGVYTKEDEKGFFRPVPLIVSGKRNGETGKPWRGVDPNLCGKGGGHWVTIPANLEDYVERGLVIWPKKEGGLPRLKYYLEENKGVPMTDLWDDIELKTANSKEALGYPTQKPVSLLERILLTSSHEGDIVLDPFCGCGTAIIASQTLNRKWIGIDITHLAIGVMKLRLNNIPGIKYTVKGEPEDIEGARELARQNKYEFQWWAVSKIGGQPYGDKKKGADTGIDGYLYFTDYSTDKDKSKKAIISVKAGGQVHSSMIRDLGHVIDREKADFGIFLTLEKPTEPMVKESAIKGFYSSQSGYNYPRIQILTIEDIFQGKKPNIPMWVAPIPLQPVEVRAEGKTKRML